MGGRLVVLLLGAGAVGAGYLVWRNRQNVRTTLSDMLGNTLPPRLAQWAPQLASASLDSCPVDVDPSLWAVRLAAVVDHESRGGAILTPPGPAGRGDNGHGYGLGQVDDRPPRPNRSEYEQALGAKRLSHIASGEWMDPDAHLHFCAVEVLRGAWFQFQDLEPDLRWRATLAAYNAGVDNVRKQLDAGLDPDGATFDGAYVADVLERSAGFEADVEAVA